MKSLVAPIILLMCTFNTGGFAAAPVVAIPPEAQTALLESDDPQLAANKRLAYDMYRHGLAGHVDELTNFFSRDVLNHNPNEETGLEGLLDYLRTYLKRVGIHEPQPVKETIDGLISIVAERDLVTLAFVVEYDHPTIPGEKYTSTWFDMVRIKDGLIVEHWDSARITNAAIQFKNSDGE